MKRHESDPVSDADLAEFIAQALGMELPEACAPGVVDAWRVLAGHWANLNGCGWDD